MRTLYLSFATALFFLGLAVFNPLQAQRNCGSMEHLEMELQNDAKRALKMQQIELQTRHFIENEANRAVNGVITIPVVVHVVYNTSAENISVSQIQSQIDVLNEDFRRTNSDADGTWSQAQDSEIEFCLASTDPSGNPTSGITRTPTTRTSFGTNDQMKFASSGGHDAWPAGDYLNVWVCDISGGILGYAQFPGGSPATDGVVCDYQYFGTVGTATAPFDLGRTMTHEVGHYLNLRHIWGDGGCGVDDFVADTPTSDGANYGCATSHVSCGTTDMVQNYMDYSDDACMNLFTAGQNTRMRAIFDTGGARSSLLNSSACGAPQPPTCTDGIQNGQETGVDCGGPDCPDCPPCTDVTVTINLDNYPEETSWTITNAGGSVVASGGTYGSQPDGSTVNITNCLPEGCYDFTINDTYGDGICCGYGNGSYTVTTGGNTVASGASFGSSETTNFCVGGNEPTPSCDDGIQNGDETGVDCGGPDCAPCNTGGCQTVNIDFNDFEGGWGIWNNGGSDCRRNANDAAYANSGIFCVRLRDNTSTSVMTTDNLSLAGFEEVTVDFTYYGRSMETGEDFWLQVSTDGGASYATVATWASGSDFSNDVREFETVVISGTFNNSTRLRFRCDASANNDGVYFDDVDISGCVNNTRQANNELADASVLAIESTTLPVLGEINLFPNPTRDVLNVDFIFNSNFDAQVVAYVTDITGKVMQQQQWTAQQGKQRQQLDASQLSPGIYLLHLISGEQRITQKFVVIQ